MASQKISQLTDYPTPLAADEIPIVDIANTTTKAVTLPNLMAMRTSPLGVVAGNSARQSQVVVSATNYYITSSGLTVPNPAIVGMSTSTRFVWRVVMDKTAAGTGVFQLSIYRGTNGTTADTQDVLQTLGTQTAAVDAMAIDVELVVTATGASGSYFWSICPMQRAATATGFGVATGTTGLFTGTVSAVAMNTAGLIFGLGFKATTGTPTISVPFVRGQAFNLS